MAGDLEVDVPPIIYLTRHLLTDVYVVSYLIFTLHTVAKVLYHVR